MSMKDAALRFASTMDSELIQIKADQMEQGQQLTERINSVDSRLKDLRSEVAAVKDTQAQMLDILIDIQRRLPS
ncbi:hypothetical protein GCM10022419_016110 [Nonomuraea rosea]|uniref:Uncharacterized protein n=1 Tax=Nonomuraea rosea TaxID=638574 RepID=A0ABP6VJU6_9ACTN